ncbi:MAG: galactokinase [Ruminococcaceae bacterium]|nr:galactokinase [Oscillospiraceae bacterium]
MNLNQKGTPLCTISQLKTAVMDGKLDKALEALIPVGGLLAERTRVLELIHTFAATYGENRQVALLTVSGRSELSGNHTDHNHGCVIAASINLEILAVASPREDSIIRLTSAGFPEDVVDISVYQTPDKAMYGSSASLIAGVCAGLARDGYRVGGFDACTVSSVLTGSGLSSSAAFEDMIGTIESHLYNGGEVDNVTVAKIAQYAENQFFGKPCGLMDQVACAVGGIVAIDFENPAAPVITPVPFDMTAAGYRLCIVDTGGNHADLTADYASVPTEMKSVAAVFGKAVLRELDESVILNSIPTLRERVGDRAILRALHFFAENRRVAKQKEALLMACASEDVSVKSKALGTYFDNVLASGRSSFCYLQNVYTTANVAEQGLSLALNLCESVLGSTKAAWRVHGGGFAGTVQAYVPNDLVDVFITTMDAAFGRGACKCLAIRPVGAARIY